MPKRSTARCCERDSDSERPRAWQTEWDVCTVSVDVLGGAARGSLVVRDGRDVDAELRLERRKLLVEEALRQRQVELLRRLLDALDLGGELLRNLPLHAAERLRRGVRHAARAAVAHHRVP